MEFLKKISANALSAKIWQQGDIHDSNLVQPPMHIEPPRIRTVHHDNQKLGTGIIVAVGVILRLKLLAEKPLSFLGRPANLGEFLRPRAGVNSVNELALTFAGSATGH